MREDSVPDGCRVAGVFWAGAQESVPRGVYRPVPALAEVTALPAK
ncbi:MAG: hypothetical protein OEW33_03085 [Nitrospirota bacterium]|nr:hypothetical protein [Nitrospirota bacterium]MDH4359705.1 hypothetical protein [Nitrospirota bacterium]